jgi:protein TonB
MAALHLPTPAQLRSLRPRAASMALAAGVTLLIILALLGLGAAPERRLPGGSPVLLDLSPEQEAAPTAVKRKTEAQPQPKPTPPPPRRPPPVPHPPIPSKNPLPFLELTSEQFAAADIGKMPQRSATGSGQQQGGMAGDSRIVGRAPNGEVLYAADWYRRPTHAELGGYLPKPMPRQGVGLIACRTVADYRVEDCIELGSSPPGSHLAHAVSLAAWQFRVRPARVNGKSLVGTWVQIRIEYDENYKDVSFDP